MTTFEKDVRKALIDKEMSITDLSNQLGITVPYLYDILKGNRAGSKQKEKIVKILELGEKR